jgi:hypothetical protein
MTPAEVFELIDKHLYISLGTKPGIMKDHRLIWSEKDDRHYVMICDQVNGSSQSVLGRR